MARPDQIGLPEPLVLPGSMEEQDVVRAVLSKFGDEARAEQQRMKMINSTPPRDVLGIPGSGQAMRDVGPGLENFMLGAGIGKYKGSNDSGARDGAAARSRFFSRVHE